MALVAVYIVLVLLNTALAIEQKPLGLQHATSSVMKYQAMMKQEKTAVTASTGVRVESYKDDSQAIDMLTIMSECNETFGMEMDYLTSLNESGSFPDETDKTPQCYLRCVLERAGAVSAEGMFDAARAADIFADWHPTLLYTDVREMAVACAMREESCKCERSYNFVKCLLEAEIRKSEGS